MKELMETRLKLNDAVDGGRDDRLGVNVGRAGVIARAHPLTITARRTSPNTDVGFFKTLSPLDCT